MISTQKQIAGSLLSKYDWYVVRKYEKESDIPVGITSYRDAVRSVCSTREQEINAAANVEALKTIVEGTITAWPEQPS